MMQDPVKCSLIIKKLVKLDGLNALSLPSL